MHDLNKQQIILLSILISFVVSIATGIMTTSLLMQAPVELTKTVNQVVERTIETVTVPSVIPNIPSKTKQVETVVITEDDSVTSAISKNTKSVVRIRERSADGSVDNLYGLGIVVSKLGIIAADRKYTSDVMTYSAIMSDGAEINLVPIPVEKKSPVGFFKAKISTTTPYAFSVANLYTSDLKLGQTVIAVGGDSVNAVSVGRVVSLNTKDLPTLGTTTPEKYVSSIEADIAPADQVSGAPIISLSGDVVGLSLSNYSSSKTYLPSVIIKTELDQIKIAQ